MPNLRYIQTPRSLSHMLLSPVHQCGLKAGGQFSLLARRASYGKFHNHLKVMDLGIQAHSGACGTEVRGRKKENTMIGGREYPFPLQRECSKTGHVSDSQTGMQNATGNVEIVSSIPSGIHLQFCVTQELIRQNYSWILQAAVLLLMEYLILPM